MFILYFFTVKSNLLTESFLFNKANFCDLLNKENKKIFILIISLIFIYILNYIYKKKKAEKRKNDEMEKTKNRLNQLKLNEILYIKNNFDDFWNNFFYKKQSLSFFKFFVCDQYNICIIDQNSNNLLDNIIDDNYDSLILGSLFYIGLIIDKIQEHIRECFLKRYFREYI